MVNFSSKDTKSTVKKAKKTKNKNDLVAAAADDALSEVDAALFDEKARARRLQSDENDPSLDVVPNGRPLFTSTPTLSQLTRCDSCSYFKLKMEELNEVLPEGLPVGMVNEFEDAMQSAVLVRQSFLDLRDKFRRVVDQPYWTHLAPKDFLKCNESRLKELSCQILDPILLGEGVGVGWMKDGIESMALPEGSTLYDLVAIGIKHTHAAVGVVVRLRKELSLVKGIPVLIAIDQSCHGSWQI